MFFELVSVLLAIVPDYGNEYMTKGNNNWTSFKNFTPKLDLNHNIYQGLITCNIVTCNPGQNWVEDVSILASHSVLCGIHCNQGKRVKSDK